MAEQGKRRRPERKLYIPPAQRARQDVGTQGKCESYFNLDELIFVFDTVNLFNAKLKINSNKRYDWEHRNCQFRRFICQNSEWEYNQSMVVYTTKLGSDFDYFWRIQANNLSGQSRSHLAYPYFNFHLEETETNTFIPLGLLSTCQNEMTKFHLLTETDVFTVSCHWDVWQMIDLSFFKLGHCFLVKYLEEEYIYLCEQSNHDIVQCCSSRSLQLENRKHSYKEEKRFFDAKQNEIKKEDTSNGLNIENNSVCNKPNCNTSTKLTSNRNELDQEKDIIRTTRENINRRNKPIIKYVKEEKLKLDEDVNNWEDLFTVDEHLQDNFLSKIVAKVDSEVTLFETTDDYSLYSDKGPENLEHIVELYNFPATLETHDLVQAFSDLSSDAMYIKWVDDTHALLVLGSSHQAQKAINMRNPLIKARPMTAASANSLIVANKFDLKPAMKRPATNLQTARRLITNHLGTRSKLNKEQIAKESQDLKHAKEMKRLFKQNEKDAWEGNLRSTFK